MVCRARDRVLIALVLLASACTNAAAASEAPVSPMPAVSPEHCMTASPAEATMLYAMCLDCGRTADPTVAEACLDRAVEHGHAQRFSGSTGKLEALEARGDVRVARRDFAGARLDYQRAIAASRSRRETTSRDYAVLLEKTADASLAMERHGEAFRWLSQAFAVVEALEGPASEGASRLRARVAATASHLVF